MKDEIGDFYCVTGYYEGGFCKLLSVIYKDNFGTPNVACAGKGVLGCDFYRHKHPTLEQFRKEYGEEVPDDMPVWHSYLDTWVENPKWSDWDLMTYKTAKEIMKRVSMVGNRRERFVVACTPFVLDKNWRPE